MATYTSARHSDVYDRDSTRLAKVTGPLAGFAFVVFIPIIGIAMALWLIGGLALRWAGRATMEAVRVVQPSWAPSLAFLSRSTPATKHETAEPKPDAWKDDVEKKLNDSDRNA